MLRYRNLKKGGFFIANQLGATCVEDNCTDYSHRRLRNVVEEISVASDIPVPYVFVLESEQGINALVTGYSAADMSIVVTRGALQYLNRDELQGVIAHEFSHIVNGDIYKNMELIAIVYGITSIGNLMRYALQKQDWRSKMGGILLAPVGCCGLFIARLIKAAFSRQREYLADSCAIQYTRQRDGLVGALKKIGGINEGSVVNDPKAQEFSHMFFGDISSHKSDLMATHPSLIDRLKALDPFFDASELTELKNKWHKSPPNGLEEDKLLGLVENVKNYRCDPTNN